MGRINDLPSGAGPSSGASGPQPTHVRSVNRGVQRVNLPQAAAAAADAPSLRGRATAGAASGSQDSGINEATRADALECLNAFLEAAVEQAFRDSKAPDFKQAWETLPEPVRNDPKFCGMAIGQCPSLAAYVSDQAIDGFLRDATTASIAVVRTLMDVKTPAALLWTPKPTQIEVFKSMTDEQKAHLKTDFVKYEPDDQARLRSRAHPEILGYLETGS